MQNQNNIDYTLWFAIISLYNTSLGLSNISKNTEQREIQDRIEEKLDKILEILINERTR